MISLMQNKEALISVIIPCYNHGKYLPEAVNSVLNQEWNNFEIIIINDGSTDPETNVVCDNYRIFHPKIKVVSTKNRGLAHARNIGIEKAKGDYIFPLDADDKVHPEIFNRTLPIIENDETIGIVYTDVQFFGTRNDIWRMPDYDFRKLLCFNLMTASSIFRKKMWEKVGGYNPNMVYGYEDWDFWIALGSQGVVGKRVPEPLFFYRQHPNGSMLTNTSLHREEMYRQIIKNHKVVFAKNWVFLLLEKDKMWINEINDKGWYDEKYKKYFLFFRLIDKLKVSFRKMFHF